MKITGGYAFSDGRFVPTGAMDEINARVRGMRLLAGSVADPMFYRDGGGQYWRYQQREDYSTELETVTRECIEANFPDVDPDDLLDVDWPD